VSSTSKAAFRVGTWLVNPGTGEISRGDEALRLEGRAMLLLQCLAERAGEVVSVDELLNRVWLGVVVSPDSVYQAVASLRRQLGDDSRQPSYIATVPRLGYRMVARVTQVEDSSKPAEMRAPTSAGKGFEASKIQAKWVVGAVVLVGLAIVAAWSVLARNRTAASPSASSVLASPNQRSIAVLPFLDLTDGMKEEEFADGITEELIDSLSKIPDFRVPAPTASFYYKEKRVPVVDIAKALGVAYVLDGSVRKSAGRFRVAARLVRAENGYVIWSETYDRPLVDKILVQEDIAGEVTKALRASIENRP
jgi:TolB-like protein/DNA-binding winged helix-turn-helix (wHTH) protein